MIINKDLDTESILSDDEILRGPYIWGFIRSVMNPHDVTRYWKKAGDRNTDTCKTCGSPCSPGTTWCRNCDPKSIEDEKKDFDLHVNRALKLSVQASESFRILVAELRAENERLNGENKAKHQRCLELMNRNFHLSAEVSRLKSLFNSFEKE